MKWLIKKFKLVTNVEKSEKLYKKYSISTLLDLGAGTNPHDNLRKRLNINQFLVDANVGKNTNFIQADIMDFTELSIKLSKISKDGFDAVVLLHVIEHFDKLNSLLLLKHIELYAKKIVIIETPNGFVKQSGTIENPYQEHKCGYRAEELRKLGYKVTGSTGIKILRNNYDKGSYKLDIFWIRALDRLLFRFLHYFPRVSFNLFAYKIIQSNNNSKRFTP